MRKWIIRSIYLQILSREGGKRARCIRSRSSCLSGGGNQVFFFVQIIHLSYLFFCFSLYFTISIFSILFILSELKLP